MVFLAFVLMMHSFYVHAEALSLKVLTFNTWLLDVPVYPFGFRNDIAQDYELRLKALPRYLAETHADVIVLQEVWSTSSKQKIAKEMRSFGYGYSAYTRDSNWFFIFQVEMGDGLLVLSRYPISPHVLSMKFSQATQNIESYASKGALKLEIKHPDLGWIDFYASHAGAIDFENGNYQPEQVKKHASQITELAHWIEQTRLHEVSILGADLNMHYQKWNGHQFVDQYSDTYLYLKSHACGGVIPLLDSYLSVHPWKPKEKPAYTFSQANPYVSEGYFETLPSEVEDYVFICQNSVLRPADSKLVFQKSVMMEKKMAMLSDHYGVLSEFSLSP